MRILFACLFSMVVGGFPTGLCGTEGAEEAVPAGAKDADAARQVERLATLGRVWGLLKYHHPGVRQGDLDWDAWFVDAFARLEREPTDAMVDRIARVFMARADAARKGLAEKASPESNDVSADDVPEDGIVDLRDFRWLADPRSPLEPATRTQLEAVRDTDRKATNRWVGAVPNVGNTTYTSENPYAQTDYPDDAHRLLALFRCWNIIQYFFPYKADIGSDWSPVLEEFVPKFLGAADAMAYQRAVLELAARIEDSHAFVYCPLIDAGYGALRFPFGLRRIEGRTVVVAVWSELVEDGAIADGDVVLSIDGRSLDERFAELRPYVAASNEPGKFRSMHEILRRGPSETAELVVLDRDGRERTVTARRYSSNVLARSERRDDPGPVWHVRDDGIGIVDMQRFRRHEIDKAMSELSSAKGIVFDMRAYPDFLLYELVPHLGHDAAPFARFTVPRLDHPGLFVMTPPISVGAPNKKPYPGRLAVLVDESTMSRAEFVAMALQALPNCRVVGSRTAGADGNLSTVLLPAGIQVAFTGIGVFYPDGTATQRVGIRIDIEAHPKIEGIREGRDEVLERAVRYLETGE